MREFRQVRAEDVRQNLINLRQLVFEVTDACNLRCKYCAYSDLYEGYDTRENINFSFAKAKLIIDHLYTNYWSKKVFTDISRTINISFYGGEPLLNVKFIKQVITYVEDLPAIGVTYIYGMTSNGVLLDKYMDFLVEKNFHILLSLDGNEEGQSLRLDMSGKNSFNRVINNIELLKTSYPEYFKEKIQFNSVLHKNNSVESTYWFIKNKFNKVTSFSPLNDTDVKPDKIEEFRSIYKSVSVDMKKSARCGLLEKELFASAPQTAAVVDYLYKYSGNLFNSYASLLINRENLLLYPTATCIPFQKKIFVTVKGKILQCEKINHDFALGVVTDTEVILDLEQAALRHNKLVFQYVEECKSCAIKRNCRRCIYVFGNPNIDKHCVLYTTKDQLKNEHKRTFNFLRDNPELYGKILEELKIK